MKKYLDGRKPAIRALPELAEACPGFSGLGKNANRTERVYEILAGIIQQQRRATPQTFYAMREVAEFFGVALNTVARVYRRLGREGVLTLVRSSQSIIPARAQRPRHAVRGVVGMPIWLPGFLYFLDWRRWFSQLEEELARHHFVLEPIFYQAGDRAGSEGAATFVDRVLRFNPDYVLWNWPSPSDLSNMHSLTDAGVPLVVIQNTEHHFPGRIYRTSYAAGLQQGLEEWQDGRINRIIMPMETGTGEPTVLTIQSLLEAAPFSCRFEYGSMGEDNSMLNALRRLKPDRRMGVVFGDHLVYARLCGVAPEMMFQFFRKHRVMVMRQVTLQLNIQKPPPDLTVDALVFPWKKLARRIALDLSKARGAIVGEPVLLEAEWRPQIPLASVVQTIINE